MSDAFFPETLYELGYHDLISVIPPGAQLVPSSKISQAQLGKIPGRKTASGLWAGWNWRVHETTVDDVRKWAIDGANIGLRADSFPGVDIDSTDARIAALVEEVALRTLGPAPIRTGRAPKRLLMYRTDEPFGRMRLWIETPQGETHLVEVLGMGQQYLVSGVHPATMLPYQWDRDVPPANTLTTIDRAMADEFLAELAEVVDLAGVGVTKREGDGRPITRVAAGDQSSLRAPSLEALAEAVALIPNADTLFPDRNSYLRMGYAIKAAAGEHDDEGYEIYVSWADRWDGGVNDPEVVRADWRRMTGNKAVGWPWIAEQARAFGFNDAAMDFDTIEGATAPDEVLPDAIRYSDQWLAKTVAAKLAGVLRFVPESGKYLTWSVGSWHMDSDLRAQALIADELRVIADRAAREGATPKEQKEATARAESICSAAKARAVEQFLRSDRSIAVSIAALDHDPWILNTPGGIVDLKTGQLRPSDPDALCTKVTSVPPDFAGAAPEWKRFLAETTGGDRALEAYLQRQAGYALTGSTREQTLTFIFGPGGNGKGTYLNTIADILGDYAKSADMSTFTASRNEKHSTDLAMLAGARLVFASETDAGKRWDEAKVKLLTGGDKVTARFMRQDNFSFYPQFKLVFIGNHRPEIRNVDAAMKRRVQMVPFTIAPSRIDKDLAAKLRDEAPAILAWMIEGCLAWQKEGLNPPEIVRASTAEYFKDEDVIGRWMGERLTKDAGGRETVQELYASYRQWAQENGEYVMSLKRLSSALASRKLEKWHHPETRRAGYRGIRIIDRQELGIL